MATLRGDDLDKGVAAELRGDGQPPTKRRASQTIEQHSVRLLILSKAVWEAIK